MSTIQLHLYQQAQDLEHMQDKLCIQTREFRSVTNIQSNFDDLEQDLECIWDKRCDQRKKTL